MKLWDLHEFHKIRVCWKEIVGVSVTSPFSFIIRLHIIVKLES